ncbi:MAG: BRO family protein [Bifidobacterium sp.]|nr:BRO family protein [Bifidobacterium sp.]
MTTTAITAFDFHGQPVRTLKDETDGVGFIAKDVCDVLEVRTNNLRAILDDDEISKLSNDYSIDIAQNGGKSPLIISEAGFYKLVLRSRKPVAKEFQRWVTHDVLPQIRRTGGYIPINDTDDEKLILAKAVGIFQRTVREKDRIIETQRGELETVKPLAMLGEAFVGTDGTMSVTQAARHLQTIDRTMSRDTIYGILRGAGYIEAKGSSPTMKAIRPGYLVAKQYVKDGRKLGTPYARFTTKGLNWFIRRYIYGLNQPALEGI